jgi:RsiW-degrading membrane proteinase PrsW (M82 family)
VASVSVTFATGDSNLIPTIILLGSFLVPVTFVVYALGRVEEVVTPPRLFTALIAGGLVGVLGASVLEATLVRQPSGLGYLGVGLIEEAVKLAVLWLLARPLPHYCMRDGLVLGAAVGFGFAAFESAGDAVNALLTSRGVSLLNLVETEVLRGVLAPVGQGLWTAMAGGALFAAAMSRGRLRLSGPVLGWFGLAAGLHALWDASQGIAAWLTVLLAGTPRQQWLLDETGFPPVATEHQVHLFTALNWIMLGLEATVGVLVLTRRWGEAHVFPPVAWPASGKVGSQGGVSVLITTSAPRNTRLPSPERAVSTARAPVRRAWPITSSIQESRNYLWLVATMSSTTPWLWARSRATSTSGSPIRIPNSAAWRVVRTARVAVRTTRVLVGIQATRRLPATVGRSFRGAVDARRRARFELIQGNVRHPGSGAPEPDVRVG